MPYLKVESHYNDLYDRFTVDECRRMEIRLRRSAVDAKRERSDTSKEPFDENLFVNVAMYFITGERYRNKAEAIRGWMERDCKRDERIAAAIEPVGIRCLGCGSIMEYTDCDLHESVDGQKDRVLFFFRCPDCGKRRACWVGGEEWQPRPTPCPKCAAHMTSTNSRKENIITTVYSCPNCGHKKTDKLNLDDKTAEETIDPNFEADRKKYCLSENEGSEYVIQTDRMTAFSKELNDKEENKEAYEMVAKMKKLAIADLLGLLTPIVEKAGYGKFEFSKPELRRGVSIDFTLQDNRPGRSEYDSVHGLQKLLKKALEGTNWHLMSDGVTYRLGFLNGRLRGAEGEESLLELAKRNLGKKRDTLLYCLICLILVFQTPTHVPQIVHLKYRQKTLIIPARAQY
ncbi:MAG: hypothetical protein WC497_00320 [Patescibacteria group bacterium]